MTETKLAELFIGIHAHRDAMVRASGDAKDMAVLLQGAVQELRRGRGLAGTIGRLDAISVRLEQLAIEFASGLERLSRLADGAMEDTATLDLQEVADASDD